MARFIALCSAVVTALVLVASAGAAAPRYILVSGACLPEPALLDSWHENGVFFSALVGAPRVTRMRAVRRRPRLDLALFWGAPVVRPPTRPSDAGQHGWFYPADGRRTALVDIMVDGVRAPRRAPARALAILAEYGVPTRSEECARG
jgi:hypothetical protein